MEKEGEQIKSYYSEIASEETDGKMADAMAIKVGYTEEDLKVIPKEARIGQGCGNSVAYADPQPGDKVVDLGCGAGMDLFLTASRVGETGKAVGVDFSPQMVKRGQDIIAKYKFSNVEIVESGIEKMPLDSDTFDIAISNCVLNLLPDKQEGFKEILRILKPGGKLVLSDIVLKQELPACISGDIAAIVGCIGMAVTREVYEQHLIGAGFTQYDILDQEKDMNEIFKPELLKMAEGGTLACACAAGGCGGGEGGGGGGGADSIQMLLEILKQYSVNDFAMSCKVTATKPV